MGDNIMKKNKNKLIALVLVGLAATSVLTGCGIAIKLISPKYVL